MQQRTVEVATADELAAIRRRLLNVVGHELRTPASMIEGLAEEVCAASDLEAVTEVVGPALLRNARRLTRLLDDLLVAAGIQTAIPAGRIQPVDLVAMVRTTWERQSAQSVVIQGDAAVVHADPVLIERVVEAVLDNAAAYGTDVPGIRIDVHGDRVRMEVDSPGPPLHPEEVRMATEAFFRGEQAVTSRAGLGLGLAVARELLAHAGGSIKLRATEAGTATILDLPVGGSR